MRTIVLAAVLSALGTPAVAGPLERINHQVNELRPHANPALVDGEFDCDDYARLKLGAVRVKRLDPGAKVWMVSTPRGLHAVLLLSDGRVMDNLNQRIRSRRELEKFDRYIFVAPMPEDDQ